ncbi:Uncharacterised protein [Cedecea lapagei]|uniref:Uncharacterized protein n=1 Tax=Cedecea lapagei TaxID=158823 RepID=A0A3S4JBG8_9ENTR|nr:hypothetical protein [Cedecea lapagei]VEB97333.1 Uncharacterised protein [Cedecea lapagei]
MESKSREQFEAWFKSEIIEKSDFEFADFDEEEGEYIIHEDDDVELYLNIQAMLMAWQASRAALVVELPGWFVSEAIAVYDRDKIEEAMEAAGITVKGEGGE